MALRKHHYRELQEKSLDNLLWCLESATIGLGLTQTYYGAYKAPQQVLSEIFKKKINGSIMALESTAIVVVLIQTYYGAQKAPQ